jgi:hypothetical protein
VVDLQEFCFGQGDGKGVPHPHWRSEVAATVSGMRKAHGHESSDRGYQPGGDNSPRMIAFQARIEF